MMEFTTWDILRNLLLAARWTVLLSLVAFIGGGLLGLVILFLRTAKSRAAQRFAWGYIELFQGTPLLMQLFLVFFGLSLVGLNVPPWLAAGTALIVWTSAFLSEIWRGCVEAIAKGQWEASASLGMGYLQQMRWVILPQALQDRDPAHGRLLGAGGQGHGADLDHRLRRAVQGRHRRHQRHLRAVHRLRLRGAHLFRPVLAPVEDQPGAREEAECRSSQSLR